MSSPYAVPTKEEGTLSGSPETASGPWSVKTIAEAQTAKQLPCGFLRPIGLKILLTLSPLSSLADPWLLDRRLHTRPTAYVLLESSIRRRISLHEARQIALQLMVEIETARLQVAEDEARSTFALEDIG